MTPIMAEPAPNRQLIALYVGRFTLISRNLWRQKADSRRQLSDVIRVNHAAVGHAAA